MTSLHLPDRPLTFPKSLYSSIFYIWMREKAKFRARTRRPATSRFPGALLYFATMMASPPEPSLSARPPRRQAGIPARFRDGGATLADSEDSPTVKEKEQKVKKRKKSVESDSDDVSAAAAAAPAAARPAAEPAFLCAHPDCSGLPHRGCPGQSGLGSRRTQLEHVKEIHGGTLRAEGSKVIKLMNRP